MHYKITKPVRLIELFSGVGAQAMAMRRLGVNFEYWKTSDWDVNAVASYKAIHHSEDDTDYSKGLTKEELVDVLQKMYISSDGKKPMSVESIRRKGEKWLRDTYNNFVSSHNLGSITGIHAEDLEIDKEKDYCYLLTFSFPCTDLSLAGRRAGMDRDSGTASSMLWHVERILQECKVLNTLPDCLLMENVTQVHGKKNMNNWKELLSSLESLGYHNYYKDLNAKHYGVAQNRDRCFMVSLLSEDYYEFPKPIELTKRLKDYLEDTVDESYYINNEKANKLIVDLINRGVLSEERERERDATSQLTNQNLETLGTVCPQEQIEGFLTDRRKEPALLSKQGTQFDKYVDVACTLMARDYKGFGNQEMNGVLEHG